MRKPIIAGNWKMNKLQAEAKELFLGIAYFAERFTKQQLPEIVLAPTFTSLAAVESMRCDKCRGLVSIAAQNCHWEKSGAYTGEISVDMIKDAGCEYVIIGHSERRQYFSETDEMINKKAKAILEGGLIPIICCGESLEQREAGITDAHITKQIKAALEGLSEEEIARSVIAYEPIWAIGTGKTCDSVEANRVIAMIRNVVKEVSTEKAGDAIRILYGGSVTPASIEEQMSQSDIDGALVGGASLKIDSFSEIIANTMKATQFLTT
ncbi:MAG TPA: triose-phosphate isomerase [Candidatus Gastranaerophilaceae bacterium]|nr:triose-phosphate isomerase [Candidatus Gastranaerophilaceae bacterium]